MSSGERSLPMDDDPTNPARPVTPVILPPDSEVVHEEERTSVLADGTRLREVDRVEQRSRTRERLPWILIARAAGAARRGLRRLVLHSLLDQARARGRRPSDRHRRDAPPGGRVQGADRAPVERQAAGSRVRPESRRRRQGGLGLLRAPARVEGPEQLDRAECGRTPAERGAESARQGGLRGHDCPGVLGSAGWDCRRPGTRSGRAFRARAPRCG